MLLCPALWLAACGGNSGMHDTPVSAPTTTLAVSTPALAFSVNRSLVSPALTGAPRRFTVTNTGLGTAQSVNHTVSPALPAGTTLLSTCATLAPGASCTITVTPGATASAAPGDVSPVPVALTIKGANTNTLMPTLQVLDYGSVYQGGYVFAIDDTAPTTGSVGGKVAAKVDTAYLPWSSNNDAIAGIDEHAVAPCEGAVDGACNTHAVVAHYTALGDDPTTYAAGACAASTADGFTDWYLPAICESGYDGRGRSSGCGTAGAPKLQNMFSNLAENGGVGALAGRHWSSTTVALAAGPFLSAWLQVYPTAGPINSPQGGLQRTGNAEVARCVRALTW